MQVKAQLQCRKEKSHELRLTDDAQSPKQGTYPWTRSRRNVGDAERGELKPAYRKQVRRGGAHIAESTISIGMKRGKALE
ncbi:hypothetical protein NDU88_008712 [Pleurodeles waltl]|uniref:Uncharacterized protein n=1 Tax=Pleurodeles waltl TaxID=8319 RepID=A0AAV7RWI3_PLEWA|nr:hypothetical protein NDU88_008712 [Pleurodeles waltl]